MVEQVMVEIEVGISTNASELEKKNLDFNLDAMEEFLGNGFISSDYNGKVYFMCQPRAFEPNLMDIIINIKEIGETAIVWASIFSALKKLIKRCKGYESFINIVYLKNKKEKHIYLTNEDLNNVDILITRVEQEIGGDIHSKDIKKVAIIGNGFDLSHGLKTKYIDFLFNNKEENFIKAFKKLIESHNKNKKDDLNWCDIEGCMKSVALGIFSENFHDIIDIDSDKIIEEKMLDTNIIYNNITTLFAEYLQNNVMNKTVDIIESISEIIDEETLAINFNYTDTIKLYTNNVKYIHGSISEDGYIILGFPEDDVPDSCGGEFIKFRKDFKKEILNFRRFLKSRGYKYSDQLQDELLEHLYCLFSGRGEYLIDENEKNDSSCKYKEPSKEILEYARDNEFQIYMDQTDYSKVEEIIILGHSLAIDKNYLGLLKSKMPLLNRVILFKFEGEDVSEKIKSIYKIFGSIELIIKSYK